MPTSKEDTALLFHAPEASTATAPIEGYASGVVSVAEIEAQIARAEKMGAALDKLRSLAVSRTVPGDWISMGGNLYLEGDGALRIAPMIGLRLENVRKSIEIDDHGVIRVTYTADVSSSLFGTKFDGVSRTRTSADEFLTQGGRKLAAKEDIESSAYKGLVARAVQLVAGLSGLTTDELHSKYGIKAEHKAVEYRTGASDARAADRTATADPLKEIHRILLKLSDGDEKVSGDILERLTQNKEKGWPGKRDPNKLTERGVAFALKRLSEMEREFDKDTPPAEEE